VADFTLEFFGGGVVPWIDPPSVAPPAPARLGADPGHPHTYRRVSVPGPGATTVQVKARVGGVLGPADGALGGRLFTHAWAETSGVPPIITTAAGVSSVMTIYLLPAHAGHHTLRVGRLNGGGVIYHFDVET
jgi:hypothetical protein